MRILRQLRADLEAFLSGEEHGLLLLRVAHDHLPWIDMTLQEIAATSPDVYLDFPHPFVSATAYADIVTERVAASARETVGGGAVRSRASPLPYDHTTHEAEDRDQNDEPRFTSQRVPRASAWQHVVCG